MHMFFIQYIIIDVYINLRHSAATGMQHLISAIACRRATDFSGDMLSHNTS